ncbi:Cof-type HAD-IIB family hydrolase [Faecalicatena acetigenes]|uniref:Cof-type HAD-IIB family hydrolase n=1 Tax=Faecalicatena acetigenes TaxID=2981790 RepID=A0ABT2TDK3_9FIRM|nr:MULTISPECIES: Cof-type HAD-IIB family hydrolase [Lachnospiraceae]MCU6747881.1 Cof-type HAD-IIB family hydrolase [Faecalicatena acetigenes]SCI14359.1 Putative bifunctional phosphatase/peptidyl-prolyl cis-trans isomerase [uncultured Clostridium sp.]
MEINIKAVFFDVDGTLISHKDGGVPESTKEALRLLKKRGIKVVVATGRHTIELEALPVRDLEFDGYVVLNGQLCLDGEGNTIYDEPICKEGADTILEIFKRREIPVSMVEKDRIYVNFVNDLLRRRQKEILSPVPEVAEYHGGKIYQCCMYVEEPQMREIEKKLRFCRATQWNDAAYDIIAEEAGKRKGIEAFLKHYSISPKEIMAFGDGENDIDMLLYAQIGVAMGNANDKVKEAADYVTDRVDKEGIKKALEEYGVI